MAYYGESVKKYHEKLDLKTIKVRVLGTETKGLNDDYVQIIKDQATLTGKASVNQYILDLIEADIRTNGLKKKDFHIVRGVSELDTPSE